MKLYKGLVQATVEGLQDIFLKNRQADRVVEQLLKSNKKWGARDRAFIAENIYEIVRWWRLVKYVGEIDRVNDQEELWTIFGCWQIIKPAHLKLETDNELPDWTEFKDVKRDNILERYEEALKVRKIAQSVPDWIDEIGEKELGDKWDAELAALNQQAPLILRVNTLKSNIKAVREVFGLDDTEILPEIPNALILKKRKNIATQDTYKQGFFEVQDAGSQLIAPFLNIRPGLSVIDACAGAGGKTLHIASLMENKGQLIAMDLYESKLKQLKLRAKRNGAFNIEYRIIDTTKVIKKLHEKADRVLIDAPCSGLGVLKRNPDAKWKLQPEFIDNIRKVQAEVLESYSKIVKPGGKLVYATCSVLPSENQEQVEKFLKTEIGKQFTFVKDRKILASESGFDGFYMALLERKNALIKE